MEAVGDGVGILLLQEVQADLAPRVGRRLRRLLAGDADAVLAPPLGCVHRGVGAGEQLVTRRSVRREAGDADADRQRVGERGGHRRDALAQRVGRRQGVLLGQSGQQGAELLAPDPEHRVAAAGPAAQCIGHQAQRPVADLVAVEVVDLLEVVDVEQEHAEGVAGGQLGRQLLVEHAVAEQAGEGVVASLLLALLVQQRLVDRQLAEADEVQQHLVGLGAGRRRSGDGDHADRLAGTLERESSAIGRRAAALGLPRRPSSILAGAGEDLPVAAAVDEDQAGADGGLGDERVGDLPADGVELEHAGEHGRQLVQPVQLAQLDLHPLVQQAVLDGQRDAVGDRAQLGRLGLLEGLVTAPASSSSPSERSPTSSRAQATWRGE